MNRANGTARIHYQDLVESHPHLILCYLPDTTIIYANATAHDYFGVGTGELEGLRWIEMLPGERHEPNLQQLAQYTPERPVHRIQNPITLEDGSERWMEWTSRALFDRNGDISHFQTVGVDITERKHGEALRQKMLESLAEGVFGIDADGNYTFLNEVACRLLGFGSESEVLGRNSHTLSHHTRRDGTPLPHAECPVYRVLQTGEPLHSWEDHFWDSRGNGFPVLLNVAPLHNSEGVVTGAVVSFQDISESRAARAALEQRESELAEAQAIAHLGSWVSDFVADEIRWSDEVYRIFGMDKERWGGNESAFMEAVHPEDREKVRQAIDDSLRPDGPLYDIEHRIQRPDGTVRVVYQKGTVEFDGAGRPLRMIGVVHDITERREAENLLQYLSYHDVLTELPNRALFRERAGQTASRAGQSGESFAVVHLGLDRFKRVNEGMGHGIGDQLLQQAARRLEEALDSGEILARLGGDEFGVLLPAVEGDEAVARSVGRLLEPLRGLFHIGADEFYVPASAGVAIYPADSRDVAELMQRAESAMHEAKRAGGNGFHYCSGSMNERARVRVALESRLRRAVDEREGFFLEYQPRVASDSGRIVGVEALLRWRDAEGQTHSPATFIPVLEQTGLIVELGEWIVGAACRQARAWRDSDLPAVHMAVNLSATQFRNSQLPQVIEGCLNSAGLEAGALELEVTESMLMTDVPGVIRTLGQFRDMGARVAMDDFGTGYSSLAYLRHFPIDVLKIDRSFVNDLHQGDGGAAIIRTILSLADNLGMESVAEGVETVAQYEFLHNEGCHTIQGFLFARPLAPAACAELLAGGRLVLQGNGH